MQTTTHAPHTFVGLRLICAKTVVAIQFYAYSPASRFLCYETKVKGDVSWQQ